MAKKLSWSKGLTLYNKKGYPYCGCMYCRYVEARNALAHKADNIANWLDRVADILEEEKSIMWKLKSLKKSQQTIDNIDKVVADSHLPQFDEVHPALDMNLVLDKAKEANAKIYSFVQQFQSNYLIFDDLQPYWDKQDDVCRKTVTIVVTQKAAAVFVGNRYGYDIKPFMADIMGNEQEVLSVKTAKMFA